MATNDESKLPKWAQSELSRLRAAEARWKKHATAGPEESDTFIRYWTGERPIGRGTTVEFRSASSRTASASKVKTVDGLANHRYHGVIKAQEHKSMETCFTCGGPLFVLGTLGRLIHYRCRNCGSVSSVLPSEDETYDELAFEKSLEVYS